MAKVLEATIDRDGSIRFPKPVKLKSARRVIVLILDDKPCAAVDETALLSEPSLAEDWSRPEEEAAWQHLQSAL